MYSVDLSYTVLCCFFFFKQKTAYEMRISDWSSDVCSSDLNRPQRQRAGDDPRQGYSDLLHLPAHREDEPGRAAEPHLAPHGARSASVDQPANRWRRL